MTYVYFKMKLVNFFYWELQFNIKMRIESKFSFSLGNKLKIICVLIQNEVVLNGETLICWDYFELKSTNRSIDIWVLVQLVMIQANS